MLQGRMIHLRASIPVLGVSVGAGGSPVACPAEALWLVLSREHLQSLYFNVTLSFSSFFLTVAKEVD